MRLDFRKKKRKTSSKISATKAKKIFLILNQLTLNILQYNLSILTTSSFIVLKMKKTEFPIFQLEDIQTKNRLVQTGLIICSVEYSRTKEQEP